MDRLREVLGEAGMGAVIFNRTWRLGILDFSLRIALDSFILGFAWISEPNSWALGLYLFPGIEIHIAGGKD